MSVRERLVATPRPVLAVFAVAVVILGAAVGFLVLRDQNPTSAQFGREGVRTFDRAPDDLPPGIVPPDAEEVEGTVSRSEDTWTAAVTFVVDGPRETVSARVDEVLTDAGYVFRQRSYDDVTLQAVYDGPEGSVLSVTYESIPEGTGTAIVLQGSRTSG